jgi:hypothetical protein
VLVKLGYRSGGHPEYSGDMVFRKHYIGGAVRVRTGVVWSLR